MRTAYKNAKKLHKEGEELSSYSAKNPVTMMWKFIDELEEELKYSGVNFWDIIE